MPSVVVETKNLTKYYRNLLAVDHMNLKVKNREIYGLVGPNGAGKTTVIKILCGLLLPSSGEAKVLGKKVPDKDLLTSIGYMPQELSLHMSLKVDQTLELYGRIFGFRKDERLERGSKILKLTNLIDKKDEIVENLSGGEKRKLSLACALMHEPNLFFLDEPTVGIDPVLKASFWKYFNSLKENGASILLTTHYMDEVRRCDRVGFMYKGKIIADGHPNEILKKTSTDSLEDAFFVLCQEVGSK